MANEEIIEKPVEKKLEDSFVAEKPKKFNSKILIIGLPIFIVQLVVVYFLTANFLLSKITKPDIDTISKDSSAVSKTTDAGSSKELGKHIFLIEDIVVNPADTEGKRLLLTSVGFDLQEETAIQDYKSKEVLLKDAIVTTLSSKSLMQLSNTSFKDSIKSEIITRVKSLIPGSKLNTVYISKYILQ
ncbi:MAG: flagellar basal body-associated FliL family protein [Ignavibacteriaceae bacterium]